MNLTDELHISVDGIPIRIALEVTGGVAGISGTRPQHRDYDLDQWEAALETVRQALAELDEDEVVPVGTAGMALGEVFVEREGKGIRIKEDEEVVGRVTREELLKLAEK